MYYLVTGLIIFEYFVNPSKEFVRCEIFWEMKVGVGGGAPSQAREPDYHLGLNRTVNKIFQMTGPVKYTIKIKNTFMVTSQNVNVERFED